MMRSRIVLLIGMLFAANQEFAQFTKITTGDFADHIGWNTACIVADYDGDGLDDILVADYLHHSSLFRNTGNGQFVEATGAGLINERGQTAIWADFNNDGWMDFYVVYSEFITAIFYLNNRDGSFTAVDAEGIVQDYGTNAGNAVCGDVDNDGLIDMYITEREGSLPISRNRMYMNDGDTTFTKLTGDPSVSQQGNNYMENANFSDFDNDGDLDIFVTNWSGNKNFYYKNNGNGTFTEVKSGPLVNEEAYHLTSSAGDYNNDGFPDLFVGGDNNDRSHLYTNQGDGNFTDEKGSIIYLEHDTDQFVRPPNSSSWVDYDNDGYLDLFVARSFHETTGANNRLYHNLGNGTFEKITTFNVVTDQEESQGHAWADFNRDGFMDLAVVNSNQKNSLYLNNGNVNSWISIRLKGVISNSFAIGAKVLLYTGGKMQSREITSQTGRMSQNSVDAHFGLGSSTIIDSVRILWPSGIRTHYQLVGVKRFVTVTEAIDGNIDACRNEVMTYSATIPAGQYTWVANNGTILSGQYTNHVTIRWTGEGEASVSLETESYSDELAVRIISSIDQVITGPATVCRNDTVNYVFSNNWLNQACSWTILRGKILTGQDRDTVTVVWDSVSSGMVTLYTIAENGRCSLTREFPVAIYQLPEAIITIDSLILTASPGVAFQWYFNGLPVAGNLGGQDRTIQFQGVGTYRVLVTGQTGCQTLSKEYAFNATDPHSRAMAGSFIMYPNPAGEEVTLVFNDQDPHISELVISDPAGRIVQRISGIKLKNNTLSLALPFVPGIYFLHVRTDERMITGKLIIE